MIASLAVFILAIGFAFNWNKERERNNKILARIPDNIKRIYLGGNNAI